MLSFVIPVFNSEKYLNRCVESILRQSFKDFELILVDDGSTDKSPEICDSYKIQDSRIKVIHQTNSGVSVARNNGIALASGEWIGFIDSDDWLSSDALDSLYKKIVDNDSDIIQFDFILEGGAERVNDHPLLKNEIINIEKNKEFPWWFGYSWSRLYRLDCIKKMNIKFPENISWMEDTFFSFATIACANKISYLDEQIYHYFYHNDSAVNTINIKKVEDSIQSVQLLDNFLINNNCVNKIENNLYILKVKSKNKFLLNFKEINFKKFINTFPEINGMILIKSKFFKRMIYSLVLNNHYFMATLFIKVYKLFDKSIKTYDI